MSENPNDQSESFARAFRAAAITAYSASLILNAFTRENGESTSGFKVLLLGWAAILTAQPAWFANIVFAFAVGMFDRRRDIARTCSVIAVLLSLCSFATTTIMIGVGVDSKIHYQAGWYFWIASMALISVATWTARVPEQREQNVDGGQE